MAAAATRYSCSGTIESVRPTSLTTTGSALPGDAFTFGFDLDAAAATSAFLTAAFGIWSQPVRDFAARTGDYEFLLGVDPATPVILVVSREFRRVAERL